MLIKALFTLRHKHKHKHKHKHNECSHLLHKHKESDIRKRNELQNEATGGWDEPRFQNGGRRQNFPVAIAATQTKKTTVRTIPCSRAQLNNVHLPVHQPLPHHLSSKAFFYLYPWNHPRICRRGRDNCELPRQVSRRKQYSQTPFWDRGVIGHY